jgi:hypothetical protein
MTGAFALMPSAAFSTFHSCLVITASR